MFFCSLWDSSGFNGEYVGARFDKDRVALRMFVAAKMELDVTCEGKVTGTVVHQSGEFRAFAGGPATKAGACKVRFDYRILEGKIETGPQGRPLITLKMLVDGHAAECTGDFQELAAGWASAATGASTFEFEAVNAVAKDGMVGGEIPWDTWNNFTFRFGDLGLAYAKKHFWILIQPPPKQADPPPKK